MKRTILFLLALLPVLFIPIPTYAQSTDFIDALKDYRDGDIERAEASLKKEISLHPDNDAAYFYLASLLQENDGSSELAEEYFKKAVALDQDNYWYKYNLAIFYENSGRSELAAPLLEDLLDKHPKKNSLYFDVARVYVRQSDFDNALRWLDKIEATGGKSENIAVTRLDLMMHQDKGDESRAYEYLQKYYGDFRTPRLASILGDYYHRLYQDSTALAFYNQALDMEPGYSPALFGRAHCWQGLRQHDKYFTDMQAFMKDSEVSVKTKGEYIENLLGNPQFIAAFRSDVDSMVNTALNTHIADSTLCHLAGIYYYRTGRSAEAAKILMQNMNLHPESCTVAFNYLLLLYYARSYEHAGEVATIILQRFPLQRDVLLVRAASFKEAGNPEAAIEDYEKYIASSPVTDSTVALNAYPALGELYFESCQDQKAFACFKKALKIIPGDPMILNNYAYFLSLRGKDLKKALEMSAASLKQAPDNLSYLDTYGWILHLLGRDKEAKTYFKKLMSLGGKEEATILDHYAEVLYSLGEYDLAYIYWNRIIPLDKDGSLKVEEKIKERKASQNSK